MSNKAVTKSQKASCSVCSSPELVQVIDLPNLPLTGIYLESPAEGEYPDIDQALMLCRRCGHGQLRYFLDPEYVYKDTYTHRSSLSPISTGGNDFFLQFLKEITGGRSFERVVEIGCNDLYLLRKLEPMSKQLLGVDPIWSGEALPTEGQGTGKIRVLGKFVEEIDFNEEMGGSPDLVVSVHTFEHIDAPKHELLRLIGIASEETLFVLEVPGFDSLLTNHRFDQVFHQHIHYFSLASFRHMIDEIGGEYLAHTFNYQYWSGTMLVAFRKMGLGKVKTNSDALPKPDEKHIKQRYQIFKEQLAGLMRTIESLSSGPIFGYGAAQMLPTLAYHLNSDLSFLECVLDDNPARSGLTYPHLPVWIRQPSPGQTLEGASVLITALDSIRPILQRVIPLKPKHILVPLNMC